VFVRDTTSLVVHFWFGVILLRTTDPEQLRLDPLTNTEDTSTVSLHRSVVMSDIRFLYKP
jgi:hypothetical protein